MTTEQMEKEIKRVQIECFMNGFEYVGISGDGCGNMVGHSVRRLGEKNIFPVDIGQRVEFAYATEKAIDNMIESVMNPPVVSKGPSGIGGQYNKDYTPLFKNHKKVGLVARLLGYFKR